MPGASEMKWLNKGLAELHVHLRGAIPTDFLKGKIEALSPAKAIESSPPHFHKIFSAAPNVKQLIDSPEPLESLNELYTYRNLDDFLAAYLFTGCFINTAQAFEELVDAVLERLSEEGLLYAEITVSLPEYLLQGIAASDIFYILQKADTPGGLRVNWIVDLVRNMGVPRCSELLDIVCAHRFDNLVGITLGGGEKQYPPAQFRGIYARARELGLKCSVHAGEALGPQSVQEAIDLLNVDRIGHGVRAIEDLSLVRCIADRGIPLEICPSGNVVTGIYPSLNEHPVRRLYEAGVQLSINTDDPAFFGNTLKEEFEALLQVGFSEDELQEIAKNGVRHAFLSSSEKELLLKQMG